MSGQPFDDAAKSRLAKSILSGKDDNDGDEGLSSNPPALPGKRVGRIEIDSANNGYIVEHRRRTEKTRKGGDGKSFPDSEYHTIKQVFGENDHEGMLNHIKAVLKSPKHTDSY